MLALRKDEVVLALISGDAPQGQVFAIGIALSAEEIAGIRSRLPANTEVGTDQPDYIEFRDPYSITWQISGRGSDFRTVGDFPAAGLSCNWRG